MRSNISRFSRGTILPRFARDQLPPKFRQQFCIPEDEGFVCVCRLPYQGFNSCGVGIISFHHDDTVSTLYVCQQLLYILRQNADVDLATHLSYPQRKIAQRWQSE